MGPFSVATSVAGPIIISSQVLGIISTVKSKYNKELNPSIEKSQPSEVPVPDTANYACSVCQVVRNLRMA